MTLLHKSHCDFCEELLGGSDNSFARIYRGEPRNRILFGSDEFAIMPSLGQLVEGYLLVLPIKHFKALGDLPGPLFEELATISKRLGKIIKDQYGPYVLFEHGARSEGVGGCGIYHAHLHATPLAGLSDPVDALKSRFPSAELTNLGEISKRSVGLPAYLFYQDSAARLYLFDT